MNDMDGNVIFKEDHVALLYLIQRLVLKNTERVRMLDMKRIYL
jgi:hypothetical protein